MGKVYKCYKNIRMILHYEVECAFVIIFMIGMFSFNNLIHNTNMRGTLADLVYTCFLIVCSLCTLIHLFNLDFFTLSFIIQYSLGYLLFYLMYHICGVGHLDNYYEYLMTRTAFLFLLDCILDIWLPKSTDRFLRKRSIRPGDKIFDNVGEIDGCQSTGYIICFGEDPEDPASWRIEYVDNEGNFHYFKKKNPE